MEFREQILGKQSALIAQISRFGDLPKSVRSLLLPPFSNAESWRRCTIVLATAKIDVIVHNVHHIQGTMFVLFSPFLLDPCSFWISWSVSDGGNLWYSFMMNDLDESVWKPEVARYSNKDVISGRICEEWMAKVHLAVAAWQRWEAHCSLGGMGSLHPSCLLKRSGAFHEAAFSYATHLLEPQ